MLGLVGSFFEDVFKVFLYACPSGAKTLPRRAQDAQEGSKSAQEAQDDAKTLPKRHHVGPLGPSKTFEKHYVFEGFSYIQPS